MPISNPPCSTPEALEARRELGEAESLVDFALYSGAGITDPARAEAMADAGAIGFKLFTHHPPPERLNEFEGLWASEPDQIYDCLRTVAATGLRCAAHAESQQFIERFRVDSDRFGHPSRPSLVEAAAVGLVATIARDIGFPAHIVHITSRLATEEVQAAQALGVDLSAESCPHYLLLDESYIPRFGNFVKVAPPLRPAEDVAFLWEALADGSLSVVASDHAPFTPEEKAAADFATSGQGIPSLEMLVPTMLHAGLTGRFPLARAVEVMTANPAKLFGIYPRKGTVTPGSDADLVLVDPQWRDDCRLGPVPEQIRWKRQGLRRNGPDRPHPHHPVTRPHRVRQGTGHRRTGRQIRLPGRSTASLFSNSSPLVVHPSGSHHNQLPAVVSGLGLGKVADVLPRECDPPVGCHIDGEPLAIIDERSSLGHNSMSAEFGQQVNEPRAAYPHRRRPPPMVS